MKLTGQFRPYLLNITETHKGKSQGYLHHSYFTSALDCLKPAQGTTQKLPYQKRKKKSVTGNKKTLHRIVILWVKYHYSSWTISQFFIFLVEILCIYGQAQSFFAKGFQMV